MYVINAPFVEKAKKFAERVHTGHFRRDRITPYFTHIEKAVEFLRALGVTAQDFIAIGYLHDSIEDKRTTYEEVKSEFGEWIADGVLGMSKPEGVEYEEYIKDISKDTLLRKIKIADILANLSDSPSEKQLQKYTKALSILIK